MRFIHKLVTDLQAEDTVKINRIPYMRYGMRFNCQGLKFEVQFEVRILKPGLMLDGYGIMARLSDKRMEIDTKGDFATLDVSVRQFFLQIDEELLMGGQKQ